MNNEVLSILKLLGLVLAISFSNLLIIAQGFITKRTFPNGTSSVDYISNSFLSSDTAGGLWAGFGVNANNMAVSSSIGLAYHNQDSWVTYNLNNSNIPNVNLSCFLSQGSKNYIGSTDGLIIMENNVFSHLDLGDSLENTVVDLEYFQGKIWIATSGGLMSYDGQSVMKYNKQSHTIQSNSIQCLTVHNNELYFGSDSGLYQYQNASFKRYSLNLFGNSKSIYDILSYNNDVLCISTEVEHFQVEFPFFVLKNDEVKSIAQLYRYEGIGLFNAHYYYPKLVKTSSGKMYCLGKEPILGNETFLLEFDGEALRKLKLNPDSVGENSRRIGLTSEGSKLIYSPNRFENIFFEADLKTYSNYLKNGTQYLDVNNLVVPITPGTGKMFWDESKDVHLSFPKENPKSLIFMSGLWMGGVDQNDSLHISAQTYGQSGKDFYPGPIDKLTGYADSNLMNEFGRVWKINRAEIEEFKASYKQPNYQIPSIIRDWPARGNNSTNWHFSTFIDENGDGIYNPKFGDYPLIKGDQMIFWVINDNKAGTENGDGRESGGRPLGVEMHCYAYAYQCNDKKNDTSDVLNSTLFLEFEIYNLSSNTYDDFRIGSFVDGDLGYFGDDFVGFFKNGNMGLTYNGDTFDEKRYGFGVNKDIKYCGTQILSHETDHFVYYNNDANPINGNPTKPENYYGYLNGVWKNGTAVNSDSSVKASFQLDSIIENQARWDGLSSGDLQDSRYVQSIGLNQFKAGHMIKFDYAIHVGDVFAEGVQQLPAKTELIQMWYDNNAAPSCLNFDQLLVTEGLTANYQKELIIYPNPANSVLHINIQQEDFIGIVNSLGKKIFIQPVTEYGRLKLDISKLPPGVYLVQTVRGSTRFVKE